MKSGYLRVLLVVAVGLLVTSCDLAQVSNACPGGVYGVWISDLGYVLTITRNNKYFVCDKSECFGGDVRLTQTQTMVFLDDFFLSGLSERFGIDNFGDSATFRRSRDAMQKASQPNALDFYVPARISRAQKAYCGGTPAQLNAAEGGVCFRRVLTFPA